MHSTDRNRLPRLSQVCGAVTLLLVISGATASRASQTFDRDTALPEFEAASRTVQENETQLAYFPFGRGIRGPVYHYGYGPSCGPMVPTTRTMKNNLWQSHQWKGEYPVCQPLYAPNFGHFQTHWHRFPGEDGCDEGPALDVRPF